MDTTWHLGNVFDEEGNPVADRFGQLNAVLKRTEGDGWKVVTIRSFKTPQNDEVVIRRIFDSRSAAWNKHDVASLASPFCDDIRYVSSSGEVTNGKAAMHDRLTEMFASVVYKGSKAEQAIVSLRFIGDDVAVVEGTCKLTGKNAAGNGTSLIVMTKSDSAVWNISSLNASRK